MYYTYINYNFFQYVVITTHVHLLRSGCLPAERKGVLIKIFIKNIIILSIWAQAFHRKYK